MAAAFFDQERARVGVDGETWSAGLLEAGEPVLPDVVEALREYDIDVAGHRSRRLSRDDVAAADLIIGLERRHVREAVLSMPAGEAWKRTFTLRELVRRAATVGPAQPNETLPFWLERLHAGRRRDEMLGASPLDDVADPAGRGLRAVQAAASTIADLVHQMTTAMFGTRGSFRRSGAAQQGSDT